MQNEDISSNILAILQLIQHKKEQFRLHISYENMGFFCCFAREDLTSLSAGKSNILRGAPSCEGCFYSIPGDCVELIFTAKESFTFSLDI